MLAHVRESSRTTSFVLTESSFVNEGRLSRFAGSVAPGNSLVGLPGQCRARPAITPLDATPGVAPLLLPMRTASPNSP